MKFFFILLMTFLVLQCSAPESKTEDLSGLTCTSAEVNLKSPSTFEGVIDLINALPKPLSLNCFLYNYDPPFDIFAVNNTFNAQPSAGPQSPRIFIFKDNFMISIVPDGPGRDLIEFSKATSYSMSIKGEVSFPIETNLSPDAAYTKILNSPAMPDQGTVCSSCHAENYLGNGVYESALIQGEEKHRITSLSLKKAAQSCPESNTSFRCQMLKVIFNRGEARDVLWPVFDSQ